MDFKFINNSYFMETFLETFILLINITRHKNSPIENLDSSIYNGQSLVSTYDIVFFWQWQIFYFGEGGKLDLQVIVKRRYPVLKKTRQLFSLSALKLIGKIRCKWLLYFDFLG